MRFHTLDLHRENEVATLTLNRPEKRNALSPVMMAELHAALDEVESGPARVLILTGAGKVFCAGMDLAVLKAAAPQSSGVAGGEARALATAATGIAPAAPAASEAALADSRRIADLFRRLYRFPKPLIAAVNGHAVAGGCGIATLCDFTLAVPEARFAYTEVRIGFMPAFVAVFLVRQIGEKRARDLLLSGRTLEAEEARHWGLVNEVVAREKLRDRAQEVAAQLITASPTSLEYTKRLLGDLSLAQLDHELELAIEASARIRSTPDFHEGLSAFVQKRQARWGKP